MRPEPDQFSPVETNVPSYGRKRPLVSILVIVIICSTIELAFICSDFGLIGPPGLRSLGYQYGGFWPGLLRDWQPNYTAQAQTMFFTYAFLHGGIVHLIVNMVTLFSLGRVVIERVGHWRFLVLYLATAIGGAAGYGLIGDHFRPMVGASGALFGLAGAFVAWEYVDRFTARIGLWPVARGVAFLILLNVVLWWAMDGQLAWETHLGGFLSGWLVATILDPRSRLRERPPQ
ncbi:MAG: rhomboid family intramembrane serine protease [Pseudomonadota bacterium]